MSTASTIQKDNRLLAALPEEDYRALLPFLEPVALPLGMALYESGGVQGYVYFPTSGIVSLLYVLMIFPRAITHTRSARVSASSR